MRHTETRRSRYDLVCLGSVNCNSRDSFCLRRTRSVRSQRKRQGTFRADLHNGGYTDDDISDVFTQRITTPFHIYKSVFIPNGIYHFTRHQLTCGSGQDRSSPITSLNVFVGITADG